MLRPTLPRVEIRPAGPADAAFLSLMLYEAATWRDDPATRPPAVQVLARPRISVYVAGWPGARDAGFVATQEGVPVGAAWYRFLGPDAPGYGFVDPAVPEMTVGVVGASRGRGIGTALIRALRDEGRRRAVPAISLSVEADNPAVRLYERCGFERLALVEDAWTMVARMAP